MTSSDLLGGPGDEVALRAVLDLHQPIDVATNDYLSDSDEPDVIQVCSECGIAGSWRQLWPCRTVRAIWNKIEIEVNS